MGRIFLLAALAGLGMGPTQDGWTLDDSTGVQSLSVDDVKLMLERPDSRFVVVVMAAWCAPCIQELPDLQALHQKYERDGLNLIGLSIDYAGLQAIVPIIKRHRVTFPVYWTGEAAIEAFDIKKIPLLMIVKNGVIVNRLVGMRSREELEAALVETMYE